jgi:HD-like signal output (HDOD) protein
MPGPTPPGAARTDAAQEAFVFVQSLAAELARGRVDLPGFPEIVLRVRQVLADENVSAERVARVLGAEPLLATRLLRIANSAALNPSGKSVSDLRTAISRVGLDIVRSTTVAFAVHQLRLAPSLRGLEKPLETLWQRSVLVASHCYVLARRLTALNPDIAMLAGLLHGIGRLYILTRASHHRALFADVATYQAIERDWHLGFAVALLEHWGIAGEIITAVGHSEDFAREPGTTPAVSDVLIAAILMAVHQGHPDLLDARLQNVRPIASLKLNGALCQTLLNESALEISALREALA